VIRRVLCFSPDSRLVVPLEEHHVNARYHIDRNRITGGGISSGIDAALAMAAAFVGGAAGEKAAKQTQLGNQYSPAPPFNDGLPHAADPDVLAAVTRGMTPLVDQTEAAIKRLLSG
jgi:cyclohexyl-isocyanide hydratase